MTQASSIIIPRLVLALVTVVCSSCSEERPLQPPQASEPLLHEPYKNREAEELALHLSGEIIAPESLYARVERDLSSIRSDWSDSIPELLQRGFKFRYVPGEVVINLHDELDASEWLQQTTALDRFKAEYKFDSISIANNQITLRSHLLLNTSYLFKRLERLAGVCWAQVTTQIGASLGGFAVGDTIYYMCQVRYGIRFGWVTFPGEVAWFRSDPDEISFMGRAADAGSDTIPSALEFVMSRRARVFAPTIEDSIEFRDETPPARATDLKFIGDQAGSTATIQFTSTGDDGNEGAAYRATVCYSTVPITDANFRTRGVRTTINPGFSGDVLTLTLTDLSAKEVNYVAVQFMDCNQNLSRVSNLVQSRNIWLNGWTYLNSGNSPLPDDRITTMIKDSRERMWIGTRAGLACKDQDSWTVYRTSNSGIPYDHIIAVTEGPDGVIWVGTPQGLGRFDGASWQSFTTNNSDIPNQAIRCVEASSDGALWIGCGQIGLVRYFDGVWTVYGGTISELNGVTVNAIHSDSRGDIWVGTNYGITRIEGSDWSNYDPMNGWLASRNVTSLFEDDAGRVWCGSSFNGVSWFDGSSWRSGQVGGANIRDFTQIENGALWIAGTLGIWRHANGEWLTLSEANSGLPSRHCTGIVTEGSRTLWVATADKGLCRWDLKAAKLDQLHVMSQIAE